ncbi:MAG TPA: CheR family methyltransferase [Salinivirgaceae bacterium]|nr:CheR family methyltransferase [Salinivirgaceae bacterium]
MINDIGIVDTKKIIATVAETYSLDLSNLALTALKRRILKVLNDYNYTSVVDFVHKIETDPRLFEKYLSDGMVDTTEMFRDPSFWRDLRDIHLPELIKTFNNIKVHIPGISSGDEVYSLMILLKEAKLTNRVSVTVSSLSQLRLDALKAGAQYDFRKMENSDANYKRFNEAAELSNYYKTENNKVIMDASLVDSVEIIKGSYLKDLDLSGFHLVIYPNRMIYFNSTLQDKVVEKLVDSLVVGGLLCVGVKENIEGAVSAKKLLCLNTNEKIYKKRTA